MIFITHSDTVAIAVSVVFIVLIGAGLYAGLFVYRYNQYFTDYFYR